MYLNGKADTRCFENQKLHEPKKNHWQKPYPCPSRVINHKGLQAQILRDSKEQRRKGKDRKINGNRAGTLLPSTARRMRATLGSGPIQMFTEHLPTSIYEGLIPQYPEEIGMYSLFAPLQVLQRSWWAGVTGFTMIYYHLPWSSPHQLLCLLYWRRSWLLWLTGMSFQQQRSPLHASSKLRIRPKCSVHNGKFAKSTNQILGRIHNPS